VSNSQAEGLKKLSVVPTPTKSPNTDEMLNTREIQSPIKMLTALMDTKETVGRI
jgi:hypothetical protein